MMLNAIPILSWTYTDLGKNSYWKDSTGSLWDDLFTLTYSRKDFERFTGSRTDEKAGPQIKFCLLREENDSLSVVINHMVTDGGGFKQCMYLFAGFYSQLLKSQNFVPEHTLYGDRGFESIVRGQSIIHRLGLLLSGRRDNNQRSTFGFPMDNSKSTSPFIVSREIPEELFRALKLQRLRSGATVNDFVLAAYFRALSKMLGMEGLEISIPIMIDMRRYLQDKDFMTPTNLSSTTIVKTAVLPGDSFADTLNKISFIMNRKKSGKLGMNTFLKLDAGFRIPFVNAYGIMAKVLKHPSISMTNIGIIDSSKLVFDGLSIENAVMFASIKYRPYLQLSVTSFGEKMTLGFGLYGSERDRENIEVLLDYLDKELNSAVEVNDN
ncbi:MAG: hypothetical protein VB064_07960 [Oscillospiraceae bacterium]|nr:hypothetical protein [Oscillospiraceae bacterium]